MSLHRALCSALFLAAVPFAFPQTSIVNWGGDYVTSSPNFSSTAAAGSNFGNVGGTSTLDSRRTIPFSETTPLNPSSLYSGGTFYGAATWIRYDGSSSPGADFTRITNNSTTDTITFRMQGATGATTGEGYGLVFWQKEDFLNLSDGPVGLGSSSVFAVTLGSATANIGEARWVVKNGSNYYVSQTTFTTSSSLSNAGSALWSVYNPATNLKFTGSSYTAVALDNVQAVGLYFANYSITWSTPTTGAPRIDIEAFTANAMAVVPEPSTYAIIFGGLTLAMAVAKRRRKDTAGPICQFFR